MTTLKIKPPLKIRAATESNAKLNVSYKFNNPYYTLTLLINNSI